MKRYQSISTPEIPHQTRSIWACGAFAERCWCWQFLLWFSKHRFFSLIMVKLQTLAAGSPASPLILSHNPSFFCEDGENATYLFWKLDGAHCGELEVFTKRSHFSVSHFHELTQFGTILCSSLCKKKVANWSLLRISPGFGILGDFN